MSETVILKALVGSQAHGLADEDSDNDYRGVFVAPTVSFFTLGTPQPKPSHWFEGDTDNMSWELGHFLHLATKGNPTILEVFNAPVVECTELGAELRMLFPFTIDTKAFVAAHLGYAKNQRTKFLDNKDGRANKYIAAQLRVLYQAFYYMRFGEYIVDFRDTEIYNHLVTYRKGDYDYGEALATVKFWQDTVQRLEKNTASNVPDYNIINRFILKARRQHWNG